MVFADTDPRAVWPMVVTDFMLLFTRGHITGRQAQIKPIVGSPKDSRIPDTVDQLLSVSVVPPLSIGMRRVLKTTTEEPRN